MTTSSTESLINELNAVLDKYGATISVDEQPEWTHYIAGKQPASFVINVRGEYIDFSILAPKDRDEPVFPYRDYSKGIAYA